MTTAPTLADEGFLGDWDTRLPMWLPKAAIQQMLFLMEKGDGRRHFYIRPSERHRGGWQVTDNPEFIALIEANPDTITAAETRPKNPEWPWN